MFKISILKLFIHFWACSDDTVTEKWNLHVPITPYMTTKYFKNYYFKHVILVDQLTHQNSKFLPWKSKSQIPSMKTFDAPIKIRSKSDLKIFFIPNHTKLRTRKRVHPRPTSNLASISVLPQFLELTSLKK